MSYDEVAAILGVLAGTIRSRLSGGRKALRQLMGMESKEEAQQDVDTTPRRRMRCPVDQGWPSAPQVCADTLRPDQRGVRSGSR